MALQSEVRRAVELCSGIDALYLSAIGPTAPALLDELDLLRSEAESADMPVDASLGGYPCKVLPRAWGKYKYCAVHQLARIGFTPSDKLPAVRFQPTALALHSAGPQSTVLWARNFLDSCGIDARLQVARLDLHADWQDIEIRAVDRLRFVTYSDRRALYEVGDEMSGLTFGKRGGALVCRIYDKTREMTDKGHDWWPDVWGAKYDASKKVMRIEFEFSRQALREFGVDSPEDAFEQIPALWAYAACNWLSLRVPTDDDTRSRWPIDWRWDLVQRSSLRGGSAPAERIKEGERQGQLRTLRKLATGVLTSMALPLGTADIAGTLTAAEDQLVLYEQISGRSFSERIDDKRQRKLS